MRYFSYDEPILDNEGNLFSNHVVTLSEVDIRRDYYPWWYDKMCKKYGKDVVDRDYCFEDCLDDWIIVNWARVE